MSKAANEYNDQPHPKTAAFPSPAGASWREARPAAAAGHVLGPAGHRKGSALPRPRATARHQEVLRRGKAPRGRPKVTRGARDASPPQAPSTRAAREHIAQKAGTTQRKRLKKRASGALGGACGAAAGISGAPCGGGRRRPATPPPRSAGRNKAQEALFVSGQGHDPPNGHHRSPRCVAIRQPTHRDGGPQAPSGPWDVG